MSAKTLVPRLLTSTRLRNGARAMRAAARGLRGGAKRADIFLQAGDPYSELLAQAALRLAERYGLDVATHAVSPPDVSAAPQPELLAAFAREDARIIVPEYGLTPDQDTLARDADTSTGDALRAKRGHYSSAMTLFEGEWYWGVDRLHYLEARLGARPDEMLFAPPREPNAANGGEIEFFYSLRSPYSYIAAMRVFDLAERWNARVRLRPVLPMVMRALPVPLSKRIYIVRDAKREAARFDLPFGAIADPVGAGVERGLAVAVSQDRNETGRAPAFIQSFLKGVFAEGVDAAGDGLYALAARADIPADDVNAALAREDWRETIEANRQDLFASGLWGVPTFKVGARATFGQDRLWLVGRWLNDAAA